MDSIKTFYYLDINSVLENFDNIFKTYLSDGVLCLTGAFFSESDQKIITKTFADRIGLNHISNYDYEDHSRSIEKFGSTSKDDIFINWHLEHVYAKNPQMIASWNMVHFTCDKDSGKTGFIKVDDVKALLPEEHLSFLDKSVIEQNKIERSAMQHYDVLNKNILRIDVNRGSDKLVLYNGIDPTKNQIDYFNTIQSNVHEIVRSNINIQKWWSWDVNDMIIIDLHRMIHCVKGGFDSSQRKFRRIWGYKNDPAMYQYNFFGSKD